ncbi:GIY-YIG nuclease family protein [Paenibacillus yanchengensis]|uniref:GIY-YIG nuclease family protein n=1 Tax=Paenibacillus yanchengensis TaxID=2035833 RepID=A0ABW4YQU3_9BACL
MGVEITEVEKRDSALEKSKRKQLVEQFNEIKVYMGVVQIKNNRNNKIFINSYPNLKNKWFMLQMQLNSGLFVDRQLQLDWIEHGAEAFSFEILEQKDTEKVADIRWETKQMLKRWLEQLQPYDERGYNKPLKN